MYSYPFYIIKQIIIYGFLGFLSPTLYYGYFMLMELRKGLRILLSFIPHGMIRYYTIFRSFWAFILHKPLVLPKHLELYSNYYSQYS
jgi:hypothetical protein